MLRPCIPTFLLASQFLFVSHPSSAQSSVPSSSCPCTLRGSVVDSVSGQPVPHALVKLTAPSPRALLTDSVGKFQFEGLPAGTSTLEATKPGYLSPETVGAHLPPIVSVQLAPDSPPAILKLTPESIIFGQVADERGEPLEGFTVTVWTRTFDTGTGEVGFTGFLDARTDDEGKFRIAKLGPGSYYLLVRPAQGASQKSQAKSQAPSGYVPVYYPRVDDLFSATPIKLLPGKSVQINFSLKREPFVRLSGTVSGYSPGDSVNVSLRAAPGVQDPPILFDPGNGSFHTEWIPPGLYTLMAQAGMVTARGGPAASSQSALVQVVGGFGEFSTHSFASQPINALSSVSDIHLALQPTADIPIVVHGLPNEAFARPYLLPRFFALIPKTPGASSPEYFPGLEKSEDTHFSGDLPMVFTGIPAGNYELKIGLPYNAPFYVESASSGALNLLRENLVLSGSIPPIDVVLRDDPAALSGTISSGNTPVSGVVVLLPDSRSKPIIFVADSTGSYRVSGLAPGAYRVFAVVPAANPDYLDAAFQQKISSKIQEITLTPRQSASMHLELATVEE